MEGALGGTLGEALNEGQNAKMQELSNSLSGFGALGEPVGGEMALANASTTGSPEGAASPAPNAEASEGLEGSASLNLKAQEPQVV